MPSVYKIRPGVEPVRTCLFPPHLLHATWHRFWAAGYSQPVTGAIYRGEPRPTCGLFAMNECPRGCAQLECLPCSFHGNIPLVYFFPRAARSTLRGYHAYPLDDGRPPWIFGGVTALAPENCSPYDLSRPDAGYQTMLNGAFYIIMADRYWRIAGEQAILPELYESLKRCNDFSMNLRPGYGLAQIMAMPTPGTDNYVLGDTEWFEAPNRAGMATSPTPGACAWRRCKSCAAWLRPPASAALALTIIRT